MPFRVVVEGTKEGRTILKSNPEISKKYCVRVTDELNIVAGVNTLWYLRSNLDTTNVRWSEKVPREEGISLWPVIPDSYNR